jgi:hypothetical protein
MSTTPVPTGHTNDNAPAGFGRGNGAQIGVSSGPRAECFSMINVRGFGSRPGGVGG